MKREAAESSFALGERVRALRRERELSQRDLAELAGLSANAVSLIERDEISPSVSTLQRLATALRVRMGYFFDSPSDSKVIVSRTGSRAAVRSSGVTIEALGARLAGQQLEPFVIRLEPGGEASRDLVIHPGFEFVHCLAGQVEYEIDGAVYVLQMGDQLLFDASLPHRWQNTGDQEGRLLLVLQAEGGADEPARRHFPRIASVADLK